VCLCGGNAGLAHKQRRGSNRKGANGQVYCMLYTCISHLQVATQIKGLWATGRTTRVTHQDTPCACATRWLNQTIILG